MRYGMIWPTLLILLALLLAGCSPSAGPAQGYELGGLRRVTLFAGQLSF